MEEEIIDLIFKQEVFKGAPPVLLDLGGAGGIHEVFKKIEPHSLIICIDADKRDFESARKENIIAIPYIISDLDKKEDDFYLTSSPHCSSRLKPLNQELSEYAFADLFEIKSKVQIESTTLKKILTDNNISTVDWFKADTQGTDLRLFKSLPDEVREKVIVAEFEPGIIDAYEGEDKFSDVLAYMSDKSYWMDDAVIKGSKRLDKQYLFQFMAIEKLNELELHTKTSPGWCEVSFFNSFKEQSMLTKRNLLLGIVFSILKNQTGFALKLAHKGYEIHSEKVFSESITLLNNAQRIKNANRVQQSLWTRIINKIKRMVS